MSLARFAIRQCAIFAVTGRTLVGDNVKDSVIGQIDKNATESALFISVYTDDTEGKAHDLFFEFAASQAMEDENGKVVGTTTPTSDPGFELVLDAIERQILVALADPANDWADLFRRFVAGGYQTKSMRGASDDGVRFAARRLVLACSALDDPPFGEELKETSVWAAFLAKMDAEPALAPTATLVRSLLGTDTPDAQPWIAQQRAAKLALPVARALLVTPPEGLPDAATIQAVEGEAEPT